MNGRRQGGRLTSLSALLSQNSMVRGRLIPPMYLVDSTEDVQPFREFRLERREIVYSSAKE